MIDRRTFLAGTGVVLLAAPLGVEAQQTERVWKIGYLSSNTPERAHRVVSVIEEGLRELGYVPGKNVIIEQRLANDQRDRLSDLARQLVADHVDLILASVNPEIAAAKQVTSTIPIVMVVGVNPVESGFAASLSRPGGNITGMAFDATPDTTAKNLSLLKDVLPSATRIAVFWDPSFPGIEPYMEAVKAVAARIGVRIRAVGPSRPEQLSSALQSLSAKLDDGVLVFGSPLFSNHLVDIVNTMNRKRLPAIYPFRDFVEVGGMMSYGVNLQALWRGTSVYIDKIFRGARPGDLPIEQPTRFELVINMKTAKALGLTIPQSLLLRADEVIQ